MIKIKTIISQTRLFEKAKEISNHTGGSGVVKFLEVNNKKYIVKSEAKDFIQSGYIANMCYRYFGKKHQNINTPKCAIYTNDKKYYLVSEYLNNTKTLKDFLIEKLSIADKDKDNTSKILEKLRNTDDKKIKEIIKKIQNGFPVDALFNNYDVVGGYINNILIDNNNNICRIDNDTSFFYNAQVGSKMELIFEKRNFIYDFWTMRSQNTPNKLEYYNKYCINTNFSVYGPMTITDGLSLSEKYDFNKFIQYLNDKKLNDLDLSKNLKELPNIISPVVNSINNLIKQYNELKTTKNNDEIIQEINKEFDDQIKMLK